VAALTSTLPTRSPEAPFFIIADAEDTRRDDVLNWVDDVAGEILDAEGIAVLERQVETSHATPLWVLQNYYGLDVTDLSLGQGT
jgi:hypothetical protein